MNGIRLSYAVVSFAVKLKISQWFRRNYLILSKIYIGLQVPISEKIILNKRKPYSRNTDDLLENNVQICSVVLEISEVIQYFLLYYEVITSVTTVFVRAVWQTLPSKSPLLSLVQIIRATSPVVSLCFGATALSFHFQNRDPISFWAPIPSPFIFPS